MTGRHRAGRGVLRLRLPSQAGLPRQARRRSACAGAAGRAGAAGDAADGGTAGMAGRAGGSVLSGVAAVDAAVGGRRPGLRVLAAGGGVLAGTVFAGWQIHRYHAGEEAEAARIAPLTDPVTGETAAGKTAPALPPLPPVTRSLLIGAAVTGGLHGLTFAEGAFARGLAAGIRRVAPGAGPVALMAGHTAALGVTVAGLGSAVEYLNRRARPAGRRSMSPTPARRTLRPSAGSRLSHRVAELVARRRPVRQHGPFQTRDR